MKAHISKACDLLAEQAFDLGLDSIDWEAVKADVEKKLVEKVEREAATVELRGRHED